MTARCASDYPLTTTPDYQPAYPSTTHVLNVPDCHLAVPTAIRVLIAPDYEPSFLDYDLCALDALDYHPTERNTDNGLNNPDYDPCMYPMLATTTNALDAPDYHRALTTTMYVLTVII